MVRWLHPTDEREWQACDKCHAAIEADDREALLDRAALIPVPRTVPERYAPKYLAHSPASRRVLGDADWSWSADQVVSHRA
jgi:hypothetical protein